ncbi:hypothetical protein [Clostridium sp. DMHC 10]|nr:hypothetical protein [Clostridium sp. DMHC 10]
MDESRLGLEMLLSASTLFEIKLFDLLLEVFVFIKLLLLDKAIFEV